MRKFWNWIYKTLGEGETNDRPPGSTQNLKFNIVKGKCKAADDYEIATTDCNDGFELWLGNLYEWHAFYNAKDARRLAWFILWTWWAKGTWFGLKRWLWYKSLRIR
jgi:hypothetical protein